MIPILLRRSKRSTGWLLSSVCVQVINPVFHHE